MGAKREIIKEGRCIYKHVYVPTMVHKTLVSEQRIQLTSYRKSRRTGDKLEERSLMAWIVLRQDL